MELITQTSRYVRLLSLILLPLLPRSTQAEVADSAATGFTVRNVVLITGATPSQVYRNLVGDVGKWWSSAHTWSGNSNNLSIEPRAGGYFSENLEGGGSVPHMVVVFAAPGSTLRMEGALGPLQSLGVAGSMTWSISKAENGTKVEVTYAVGGYRPGGLAALASPVDKVLFEQLMRFKNFVEKGKPE